MFRRTVLMAALCLALDPAGAIAAPVRVGAVAPAVPPVPSRPLAFEANDGQTDGRVRFVARGGGTRIFLTAEGATVVRAGGGALRLRFASTSHSVPVVGESRLPGVASYFVGANPRTWRRGVATYERVRYAGLWPGVDAVFYGTAGTLEHDFVVAPGADPAAIALDVDGATRLTVDTDGRLVAETPSGPAVLEIPAIYQTVDGVARRIGGRFALQSSTRVGFEVGAFDRSLPLVVDPVLTFSTYLAASADESGAGVTLDGAGNVYLVGGTTSLDYPTTPGAYATTNAGLTDGFLTKISPDGTTILYSTYFGGSLDDGIARSVVDASGNVYLCGGTASTNFPTTAGAFQTTFAGGSYDAFVTKLDPTGTQLLYSTYLGGGGDDGAASIVVDGSGNAYFTGGSTSNDYPTTPGAFDTNNSSLLGLPDAFVTKLNAAGSALVYSTYLGGSFNLEAGGAIAVDASGNAFVAGGTNGGFPTTGGAFDTSFNGSFDGFVTKLNASGSGLLYSTYLGGSGEDYIFGLAVDASGNAYLTGYESSTNFPVLNAFQPSNAGGFDAFVTKLNASGSGLVYSSYLGGSGDEGLTSNLGTELQVAGGIAVDAAGAAYLTGFTSSADFPVVAAWQPHNAGGFDAWAAKIDPSGTSKVYASYLGGEAEERGLGVAVDASGSQYVTGYTYSTNFPTTAGVVRTMAGGNLLTDGFLAKIGGGPGDTAGVYLGSTGAWFLRTSNSPGLATSVFSYGPGGLGWVPIAGDWDGNGTETAGLYDPATGNFFLKNTNRPGSADLVFSFGAGGLGFRPLAGDWDGDGIDTIGLYDPSTSAFFLRNANAPGPADVVLTFGAGGLGYVPVTGDWNGDRVDTVGLYAPSTSFFFLRNANSGGNADLVFGFGAGGAGFVPLAGDWNGDGTDTVGLYLPASGAWFLRNVNAPGSADLVFSYGPAGSSPVVGHWGG